MLPPTNNVNWPSPAADREGYTKAHERIPSGLIPIHFPASWPSCLKFILMLVSHLIPGLQIVRSIIGIYKNRLGLKHSLSPYSCYIHNPLYPPVFHFSIIIGDITYHTTRLKYRLLKFLIYFILLSERNQITNVWKEGTKKIIRSQDRRICLCYRITQRGGRCVSRDVMKWWWCIPNEKMVTFAPTSLVDHYINTNNSIKQLVLCHKFS